MSLTRLAIASALIVGSSPKSGLHQKIDGAVDKFISVAVEIEMHNIGDVVIVDHLTGDLPPPEDFSQYLRAHMIVRGPYIHRDPSLDFWGHPYKLTYSNGFPVINSAGPDGIFGTDDDLEEGFGLASAGSGPVNLAVTPTSVQIENPVIENPVVSAAKTAKTVQKALVVMSRNSVMSVGRIARTSLIRVGRLETQYLKRLTRKKQSIRK